MKVLILFLVLVSSFAHAAECTITLRSDLPEDAIESIARGLEDKGYVLGAEGSLNLNFRERIDHRGNQYIFAGMSAILTDTDYNRVAEGFAKARIFRSRATLVMKSFRDLLAKLEDCQ